MRSRDLGLALFEARTEELVAVEPSTGPIPVRPPTTPLPAMWPGRASYPPPVPSRPDAATTLFGAVSA